MSQNSAHIEFNGVRVDLHPLTYRQRLDRGILYRKFVNDLPEDASDQESEWQAARHNFVMLTSMASAISGAELRLPSPSDDEELLEVSFQQFLDLPDGLIALWIREFNNGNRSPNDPRFVPADQLTEEVKNSPQA